MNPSLRALAVTVVVAMLGCGAQASTSGAPGSTISGGASNPGSGPQHVQNWLYACIDGTQTCSQALNVGIGAAWLAAHSDWAEVYYAAADDPSSEALAAAGERHIVVYLDPNISPYCPVPPGYDASSSDFPETGANCTGTVAQYLHARSGSYAHAYEHQGNGNRLIDHADGFYNGEAQEPFYIGDPDVQAAFGVASTQNRYATDVFEDDGGGAYNCIIDAQGECSGTYGSAHYAPPACGDSGGYWCFKYGETAVEWDRAANPQAAYAADAIALSDASALPVLGNDAVATDTYDIAWVQAARVEGTMWEGAWSGVTSTDAWIAKADGVLEYHNLHKFVVEFSTDESALFFEIASHWIVYDPVYSIEALAEVNPAARSAGTNDTTFPEESIVPTSPLVATPANDDVTAFEASPGLFVREYAACYQDGTPIGACAAIVNTGNTAVPIAGLSGHYSRVLVHNTSATWAAGGTALWQGTVPAQVAAHAGVILAQ